MGRKIVFITTDQMRYDAFGWDDGQRQSLEREPRLPRLAPV